MLKPELPPTGIAQVELPSGRYIHDLRFYPYMVFRTSGRLDVDMVRVIYSMRDPVCYWAAAHGTKVWAIWDLGLAELPDAINRKKIADIGKDADAIEGFFNVAILVKNPLLRGAVTATKWLMGDKVQLDIAPTVAAASELGQRRYQRENLEPPQLPADYDLPEWDDNLPVLQLQPSDIWWSMENRGKQFTDAALAAARRKG